MQISTTGAYALVMPNYSGVGPDMWRLFVIGRETPAVVYKSPVKLESRYKETTEKKAHIVARFATEAEALAFRAEMLRVWEEHSSEIATLEPTIKELRDKLGTALKARRAALATALQAAGG